MDEFDALKKDHRVFSWPRPHPQPQGGEGEEAVFRFGDPVWVKEDADDDDDGGGGRVGLVRMGK